MTPILIDDWRLAHIALAAGDVLVVEYLPSGGIAFRLERAGSAVTNAVAKALLLGRSPKTNAPIGGRLQFADAGAPISHEPGAKQRWKWAPDPCASPGARRAARQEKRRARRLARRMDEADDIEAVIMVMRRKDGRFLSAYNGVQRSDLAIAATILQAEAIDAWAQEAE